MRLLLSAVFTIAVCIVSFGQPPMKCGNDHSHEIPISNIDQYHKQLQKFHQNKKLKQKMMMEETVIPLQLHIIRNDDGSEIVSMDEILQGLDLANDQYSAANIRFEICGEIRYVDNTSDKDYTSGEPNVLIDPDEANPNALNVYYFDRVFVGDTEVCGLGGAEVYMGCPTGSTLSHEIGHHYSLRHTHGAYNFEPPDYSTLPTETNGFPTPVVVEGAFRYFNNQRDDNNNQIFDCLETGDGVCDTPAEPVGLDDQFDPNQCTYFGTATDFYGDLYVPEPGNVMSYGFCFEEFYTPLQLERALFSLNTTWLNEQCSGCSELPSDWVVTSAEDFGKGSLRWAYACNKNAQKEVNITFNIPGENTIELEGQLPTIFGSNIHIDGINQATGEKITLRNYGLQIQGESNARIK